VFVSPENYTCSYVRTAVFWNVRSAVGPKDKFVINIVLILTAERDSSAVEGHNSSCRNAINRASNVVMDKMCTLLTFVMRLLQHGLTYSYLMTVLSFVSISIHHHHGEEQDGKVITELVRLQTCLFLYNFLSAISVSPTVCNVLLR